MQKWEYLNISLDWIFGHTRANIYSNGKKIVDDYEPDVYKYLNKLGKEGWELVSVLKGDADYLYFKRPIE